MTSITLQLRAEDAEPILRKAAYEAAKYGGLLDYVTRKTFNSPAGRDGHDASRARWQACFLAAKRTVEAFGVEHVSTSEDETMTVEWPYVGGKRKLVNVAGVQFVEVKGSKPDYDNPKPRYRGEVHTEACKAAAERVVQAWKETLLVKRAA